MKKAPTPSTTDEALALLFKPLGFVAGTNQAFSVYANVFSSWLIPKNANCCPDIGKLHTIVQDICVESIEKLAISNGVISLWGCKKNSVYISTLQEPTAKQTLKNACNHCANNAATLFEHVQTDLFDSNAYTLSTLKTNPSTQFEIEWRVNALKGLIWVLVNICKIQPNLQSFLQMHTLDALHAAAHKLAQEIPQNQTYAIGAMKAQSVEECLDPLVKLMQLVLEQRK